jgi:tRNA-dihydrouridine synthase
MAHTFIPDVRSWGPVALTLHGRTRQQRYSRQADWEYIGKCAELAPDLQLIGNGDVFSYNDWNEHLSASGGALATCMIGRGALVKPWVFTEIKVTSGRLPHVQCETVFTEIKVTSGRLPLFYSHSDAPPPIPPARLFRRYSHGRTPPSPVSLFPGKEQRHWDISATERLDIIKRFCNHGLEHWGSDSRGVETTRRFLLEWLSYLCRYVPVGMLEVVPQRLHLRPPALAGRSDLETLLCRFESSGGIGWPQMSGSGDSREQ